MTPTATEPKPAPAKPAEADPYFYGWRYVWQTDDKGEQVQVRQPLTYEDVLHPREDDFIVQHSKHHADVAYLEHAFLWALNGRQDVRIHVDVRTDWGVEGVKAHGPDVTVFVGPQDREPQELYGTYKPKEVGTQPILVVEVTSPSTRSQNLHDKVAEYFQAGIPFYAIVDYLTEQQGSRAVVLGYRATPEGYLRLPLDEHGRLWLEPVGLWLGWDGRVVCFDQQNTRIPTGIETKRRTEASESRSDELQQITEDAILARQESERQRLDAEKRADDEKRQREAAERERQQAEKRAKDEERQRLDAEKRAADLATQMADLEAELRRLRGE